MRTVVDEWAVPTSDRGEQRFRLVDFGEEFGLEFLYGTWEPVELVCLEGAEPELVAMRSAVFSAICARLAQRAAESQVVQ